MKVFASNGAINWGQTKASILTERFGNAEFDYVGNSFQDLHIWRVANRAIVVSDSKRLLNG